MDALPEDWQAVPNEKEKCEEITRLTVPPFALEQQELAAHLLPFDASSLGWLLHAGVFPQ